MYVSKQRAATGVAISRSDYLTNGVLPKSKSGQRLISIKRNAINILNNFDYASTERLHSSIRTAALARTSFNPENQLISLWSAIEVLLSEPRDEARIVHYSNLIVPCITLRHARRQIYTLFEELLISYRSKFAKILEKTPTFNPALRQRTFADLLLLPENSVLREELCNLLSSNPLALHRLWKINNDYKDVKSALKTTKDHAERVKWQIHRIYRSRNQLVHLGQMPTYTESIILNLAEYFRSSIATIINRSRFDNEKSDIDQIVSEIMIRNNIVRSKLEENVKIPHMNSEMLRMLLDESS